MIPTIPISLVSVTGYSELILKKWNHWNVCVFYSHQVYAQKETCSEELNIERLVAEGLQQVLLEPSSELSNAHNPKLQLIWGTTMYHIDDLPFDTGSLPDVYTQFRKA